MRVFLYVLLFSLFSAFPQESENVAYYTEPDSIKCEEILNNNYEQNRVTTTDIAKLFLGTPYQGGTLDRDSIERVVARFDSLDCTTFVETVTALARCINNSYKDFSSFVKQLEQIRYRNGVCNGYASRLHYFSDWIYNNQATGIVEEILPDSFIVTEQRSINFMSCNADKYKGIKTDSVLGEIKATEAFLSSLPFNYIPKERVADITPETIREGDIIAIVTDIDGLDFTHVGFATIKNGQIHLLHASSAKKEVVIDPLTLSDYLANFKRHKGIRILRHL